MKTPETLLAKSHRNGRELSLERHLRETEDAAQRIFRLEERWGQNWCRFFRLKGVLARQRFLLNLRVAALFHDIGKANEDFYRAVTTPRITTQTLRHEHISALLLCLPEIWQWLSQNHLLDADVITAAVLSRHLKATDGGEGYKAKGWKWCQPRGNRQSLRLYFDHPEVNSTMDRVAEIANLARRPKLTLSSWSPMEPWVHTAWRRGTEAARSFGRLVYREEERLALLLAVKAGLIALTPPRPQCSARIADLKNGSTR